MNSVYDGIVLGPGSPGERCAGALVEGGHGPGAEAPTTATCTRVGRSTPDRRW